MLVLGVDDRLKHSITFLGVTEVDVVVELLSAFRFILGADGAVGDPVHRIELGLFARPARAIEQDELFGLRILVGDGRLGVGAHVLHFRWLVAFVARTIDFELFEHTKSSKLEAGVLEVLILKDGFVSFQSLLENRRPFFESLEAVVEMVMVFAYLGTEFLEDIITEEVLVA